LIGGHAARIGALNRLFFGFFRFGQSVPLRIAQTEMAFNRSDLVASHAWLTHFGMRQDRHHRHHALHADDGERIFLGEFGIRQESVDVQHRDFACEG
ncbi:hypothetical protein ACDH50_20325, partial [Xanthomonas fragariae]|uniref:hypothetical protein n=1 Tax=Xanthomonas fragariae TaxID=48664 RepID=UPI0035312AF3